MKKKFSNAWKKSSKKRKQVKYVKNAPLHTKNKLLSSHLSKELRQKHNLRNITLKKGDKVKALRGKFKGKSGKVVKVDLKNTKIFVEGFDITKIDGSKAFVGIHPSNVMIVELVLTDKKRSKSIDRKKKTAEKKKE